MPKVAYEIKKLSPEKLYVVHQANVILKQFEEDGFDLTLRQLYYQFVAHDLFPDDRRWTQNPNTKKWYRDPAGTKNADPNYKWLGDIVNDARMVGLIDWEMIVDRTRTLKSFPSQIRPELTIEKAADNYRLDKWDPQEHYVEVWVEKEALAGVVEKACRMYRTPFFSCRGYASQSSMWGAGERLGYEISKGKYVHVLHLGDHDPSGVDMSRDIAERQLRFMATNFYNVMIEDGEDISPGEAVEHIRRQFKVERIALTMDQVEEYNPPPNPAKISDSRAASYIEEYGDESWELDALTPQQLSELIQTNTAQYIDDEIWEASTERENEERKQMQTVADNWHDLIGEED